MSTLTLHITIHNHGCLWGLAQKILHPPPPWIKKLGNLLYYSSSTADFQESHAHPELQNVQRCLHSQWAIHDLSFIHFSYLNFQTSVVDIENDLSHQFKIEQ